MRWRMSSTTKLGLLGGLLGNGGIHKRVCLLAFRKVRKIDV